MKKQTTKKKLPLFFSAVMEQLQLNFTIDMKGDTEPFEGDRLDSQDLNFFEDSNMDSIERRIVDWLESKQI